MSSRGDGSVVRERPLRHLVRRRGLLRGCVRHTSTWVPQATIILATLQCISCNTAHLDLGPAFYRLLKGAHGDDVAGRVRLRH